MRISKTMKQSVSITTLSIGMVLTAVAGNTTIPKEFVANTPAKAADVNANFNEVAAQINDNDARITTNSNNKQNRVTGSCNAGSSIRAIAVNGGVTCEADDVGVASVTVGAGLSGGGSGAAVSLSIANGGVDTTQIADSAVTSNKIENGAITNIDINPAAAIAASKIAGDMGIEYNATWWSNNNISTTTTSLGSIVLSAPGAGTVLLFMSGNADLSANGVGVTVGIGVGATSTTFSASKFLAYGGGQTSFSVMWATPVTSAGNYTYRGLVVKTDPTSCCTARVYNANLVALFIPKRY